VEASHVYDKIDFNIAEAWQSGLLWVRILAPPPNWLMAKSKNNKDLKKRLCYYLGGIKTLSGLD